MGRQRDPFSSYPCAPKMGFRAAGTSKNADDSVCELKHAQPALLGYLDLVSADLVGA